MALGKDGVRIGLRRRNAKEYKVRTNSNSLTGPTEAVCVSRDESFNTIV